MSCLHTFFPGFLSFFLSATNAATTTRLLAHLFRYARAGTGIGNAKPMSCKTAVAVCEHVVCDSGDITGVDAATGTCHKCGGSLSRGNPALATLCGTCGTRFHASDCGNRLEEAGYPNMGHLCPKVRQDTTRHEGRVTENRRAFAKTPRRAGKGDLRQHPGWDACFFFKEIPRVLNSTRGRHASPWRVQ